MRKFKVLLIAIALLMGSSAFAADYHDDKPYPVGAAMPGKVGVIGGIYDDAGTDSVDENDVGAVRITADRKMMVYDSASITALQIIDDWDSTHDSAIGADGAVVMAEAHSAQPAAVADGDAVRLAANVYGQLLLAGYTWATNSIRTQNINPMSEQHSEVTLCDFTNTTEAAAACGYWDMDGYRYFSLQIDSGGTAPTDVITITLECSNQDDGTAPAGCDYDDVTQALAGVASLVDADDYWIVDVPIATKYCRLWYTITGAADDQDLTVFFKKMW